MDQSKSRERKNKKRTHRIGKRKTQLRKNWNFGNFVGLARGIPAPCPQVAEDEFLPQHIDLRRFWLHARKLLGTSFYRSTLTSGISFCFFHDSLVHSYSYLPHSNLYLNLDDDVPKLYFVR
ncbi:hypothetical protein JHK87_040457 [Glycine soja]|nr:hypothetical protein JHK87_040457 [Glycine soja]